MSPIVAYSFYGLSADNDKEINQTDGAARMKIIMYYKGTKIAIRAKSSVLDDERKTIVSASYFFLPSKVQKYLVHKMKKIYEDNIFMFDNSYNFSPQKEANSVR